jgi:hypothetical protein
MSAGENSVKAIRLDIGTLEERAARLPETMRDRFIWLGRYIDTDCSRSLDVLIEQFRLVDVERDKTVWSKILRGRWNRTAEGEDCPPILSEDKFNEAVDKLRKASELRDRDGAIPFVRTPTADMIWNALDFIRADGRVNKFLVIVGETGSQKTSTLKEYTRCNNHGMVIRVEAPATPSMARFISDVAASYGYSRSTTNRQQEEYILAKVNYRKTIIVENIQQLYVPKLEARQPIFDFLKKLQEDTGCTIVVTFTPTFEKAFQEGMHKGFFEQFVGRAGGQKRFLRLAPYPPEDDCIAIAKAFGLKDADKYGKYLADIAHDLGRIRVLCGDLQEAKIRAAADKKPLTISYLKAVREEEE